MLRVDQHHEAREKCLVLAPRRPGRGVAPRAPVRPAARPPRAPATAAPAIRPGRGRGTPRPTGRRARRCAAAASSPSRPSTRGAANKVRSAGPAACASPSTIARGAEGQHAAVGARREAEGVHDAGRNHDHRRAIAFLALLVQRDACRAGTQPQHLVQAVVDMGVDLPAVASAARLDALQVQHVDAGHARLAVEGEGGHGRAPGAAAGRVAGRHGPSSLRQKCKSRGRFVH